MAFKLQLHNPGDDGQHEPAEGASARPTLPRFVATPTANRIFERLSIVHQIGDLGVVRGNAGVGKTRALKEYARRHQRTYLFTLNPLVRSRRDLLEMIGKEFNVADYTHYRLFDRLCYHLRGDGCLDEPGRALIIFDEAQHMTREAASLMRSVSDASGAGIVFAGNRDVLRTHASARGSLEMGSAAVWTGELAQITSRVGPWLELDSPEPGDVLAFLQACGIQGDREDLVAYLWRWVTKSGGLRTVEKILAEALRTEDGWPFTEESLQAAADELGFQAQARFG